MWGRSRSRRPNNRRATSPLGGPFAMGAGGGTEAHRVQWPNIRLRQARTREHPAALRWISASFARFFGAKRLNRLAPPRGVLITSPRRAGQPLFFALTG